MAELMKRKKSLREALKEAKEGSPLWFRLKEKEHGSTKPNAIERRRAEITGHTILLKSVIENVIKARDEAPDLTPDQKLQYDIAIGSLTSQLAQIEVGCLLVDCNSIRVPGKKRKTGEEGFTRYSTASYMQDAGGALIALQAMTRHSLGLSEEAVEEMIDEDKGIAEFDDEDVLTEQEEKEIEEKTSRKGRK